MSAMARAGDRDQSAGPARPAGIGGPLGLLTAELKPELVLDALYEVIDPELGVNIVDLGLVYDVVIDDDGGVVVVMTLTTPGCPLAGFMEDEIHRCLSQFPQVRAAEVEIVWDPPWDPELMSDEAREQLGWFS
jgi:metal-sulfur cluster biosynthetic enzyme